MRTAARAAWALLCALLVLATAVLGAAAPAQAADAGTWRAQRAVVVGVPGLLWSDVDPQATPELWALAQDSAIGALSVRAGRATTCLLDGWATLGAGNRARYPGATEEVPPVPLPSAPLPDHTTAPGPEGGNGGGAAEGTAEQPPAVDTSYSYCGLEESVADLGLTQPQQTVEAIAADEATRRFGAVPGLLGESVGCATVVGKAATLAVAGPRSEVQLVDQLPDAAALAAGCPLTLVSLDDLTDAGHPGLDQTDSGTQPGGRAQAVRAVDEAVGQLRRTLAQAPGTLLLLAGVSEVNDGRPRLHVAMAQGPGFGPGWLTSASTGRPPYAQLIDVAPTVLRALGLPEPASVNGQPMTATATRPPLADAVAELDRLDVRASVHYRSTGTFFWTLVGVNAVFLVLALLVLSGVSVRGRRIGPAGPAGARLLRPVALAVGALPVATYLASLVPWELAGSPRLALAGTVLAADLLVTALVALGPWRRARLGPAAALLAVTLGTLVADVLTGSHLELDGLLGYDPIVAGRFTGYGNLTFGLYAVSALLLTAGGAALLVRRAARRGRPETRARWLVPVLSAGVVTVGLLGAPSLGRDFGGVLSAVPGFLVLGMLLARIRVTVVRLAAVVAAAVVVVGGVAVLDWLRPADQRSHLGRFVAQVLDGEAWTVVSRKGQANLSILVGSALSWMLLVALVAAVWLLRPGGLLRGRPGHAVGGLGAEDRRVLRAGLTAVALSLTLGALVNDSGVALPATAATLLVPLLVWLVAGARAGRSTEDDGGPRVTVVSRGSTG
ncbi:hypothetical protein [Modestobacter sp. NPDC049651]|uniref:hypothetical protein n=1 Tax=unclassified Modestobacter TaxID=2643866 RepID=UPI0033F3E475